MTNNLLTVDDAHRSQKTSVNFTKAGFKTIFKHMPLPKQYIFTVTNIFRLQIAVVQLKVFITTSYPQGYLLHNVTIDTRVIFQRGQRFQKCCENIPISYQQGCQRVVGKKSMKKKYFHNEKKVSDEKKSIKKSIGRKKSIN